MFPFLIDSYSYSATPSATPSWGAADADNLDGGYNDDTLDGGVGNDTLNGSQGIDLLTGGSEADSFIFDINATFNPTNIGINTITDFTRQTDKIILDKTTFNLLTSVVGTGFSNTSELAVVANDTLAGASSAMIVYSSTTGNLFYNQNGITAGLGTGGQFAQLTNSPLLSASDFSIRA
jgi:Ca2+-binding RTX toxin-like protein